MAPIEQFLAFRIRVCECKSEEGIPQLHRRRVGGTNLGLTLFWEKGGERLGILYLTDNT